MLPVDLKANPRLDRWVRFDTPGRVTILSGKVELGQGAVTAIAQIAAEELDVAMERVDMVAGDTARSPDEGYTSGSQSMESGGAAMRAACAEVRQLFLEAAARRLEVSAAEIEVRDGSFVVAGTDRRTDYWSLSPDVPLGRDAKGDAKAKDSAAYTVVGTSHRRLDLPAKFSGAAYVHDIELPGMVHGRVLRSPHGSSLLNLEKEKIASLPGVACVVVDGSFVGLCAEREEQALKALEAARASARWSEGTKLPEQREISALLPTLKHETTVLKQSSPQGEGKGQTLRATYSRPFIAHASIGVSCAAAWMRDGKLTVWSHAQGPHHLRNQIARVLGMAQEDVTVVHRDGAGCYGHNGADDVGLDAALLARACGRPVLVQWSREDELASAPFGSAMSAEMSGAVDEKGNVSAWRHEVFSLPHVQRPGAGSGVNLLAAWQLAAPHAPSAPRDPPFPPGGGARNAVPLYAFASQEIVYHAITEPLLRASALRSLGAHANVFAIECFMDELAHAAGADPVEFRLRHLADERARAVIERVCLSSSWKKNQKGRGIGFARYKNSSAYCAVVAEIEVAERIKLIRMTAAVDAGQPINPDGIRNQVEGGIIQAASWTLKEEVRWGPEGVRSRSWEEYPILRFDEIPDVAVEIIENHEPPLGAGECAAGPAAAAIGNALFHALGVRARALPLTPERIAQAME